jgi:Holliday junction resolvase-like predicted endonuclease
MAKHDAAPLRAFIAAPASQDLSTLNKELTKRGVVAFTAYDLAPATGSLLSNIEQAIQDADIVIAVIPAGLSANVFFELGLAHALRKPLLILVSPKYGQLPSDLTGTFYLRTDPQNAEAIAFALDQCLGRVDKPTSRPPRLPKEGSPLGDEADKYIERITREGARLRGRELEDLVADILRAAGVEALTQSLQLDHGADIVVWSDALQPLAGNPLLVEVKSTIRGKSQLLQAAKQVERYRLQSGSGLALLVVNEALVSLDEAPFLGGVLAITLKDLIEQLRSKTFADMVRQLRNLYFHGGRG